MKRMIPTLALLMAAGPLLASAKGEGHEGGGDTAYLANAAMTYEIFEAAVPHVDLERCPLEFDGEANFCRMTLAEGRAHVFVFSHDDDQPLLAIKSFDLADGFLPF